MYIFEPNIEQITISEQVAVISDVKFGEPNENYSTLKFMHFEPSALYQSKWEEDELEATSSETRSHADKSDKALWSASNQTDCKHLREAFIPSPLLLTNWNSNVIEPNV